MFCKTKKERKQKDRGELKLCLKLVLCWMLTSGLRRDHMFRQQAQKNPGFNVCVFHNSMSKCWKPIFSVSLFLQTDMEICLSNTTNFGNLLCFCVRKQVMSCLPPCHWTDHYWQCWLFNSSHDPTLSLDLMRPPANIVLKDSGKFISTTKNKAQDAKQEKLSDETDRTDKIMLLQWSCYLCCCCAVIVLTLNFI